MINDSVQAENSDDFGMSEHDIRPSNYGSDNEIRDDEKRDDEKRDDDTCVKCEKTFNRIGGGTYDGVLSYCNDCYATGINIGPKDDKVVDTTVGTVRSFLLQMSTINNADHIDSFRENSYRLDKTASDTKSTRFLSALKQFRRSCIGITNTVLFLPHQMLLFFLVRCPMEILV